MKGFVVMLRMEIWEQGDPNTASNPGTQKVEFDFPIEKGARDPERYEQVVARLGEVAATSVRKAARSLRAWRKA